MAKEWPCLADVRLEICSQVLTQAIGWRREDMAYQESGSRPAYEDAIADSLKHLSARSADFQKRVLLARLERVFGPEGLGQLHPPVRLRPDLVEGTWEGLVENLRALFGVAE